MPQQWIRVSDSLDLPVVGYDLHFKTISQLMMLLIPETTLWEPLAMFLVPSDQADTLAPSNIIDLSMERVLWAFHILDVLKVIPCTLKAADEATLSKIKATLSEEGVEVQVEAP